MTSEETVLAEGPEAVISAVRDGLSEVSRRFLGQECYHRACVADAWTSARPWAEAGIACYRSIAATILGDYERLSAETLEHGMMVMMIRRFGSEDPELAGYRERVRSWCREATHGFVDERSFRAALQDPGTDEHLAAVLVALRLQDVSSWGRDLFAPGLDAWFAAAGISP